MEAIHQEFKQVNQAGVHHEIVANTGHMGLTYGQMYFALAELFIFLVFAAYLIYKFSSAVANKSCVGCKRLKRCENEIKSIKTTLALNEFVDVSILEEISAKVDELKKKVIE